MKKSDEPKLAMHVPRGTPSGLRLVGAILVLLSMSCAKGDSPAADTSVPVDTAVSDARPDVQIDAGPGMTGMCESCASGQRCLPGVYCATFGDGSPTCVRGCDPAAPNCPAGFECIMDGTTGVDAPVCVPTSGACCIDEDGDEHGIGVGCLGTDCDDADPARNSGNLELCNGIDDDCDGAVDGASTDCSTGRCAANPDGTYTAVGGAACVSGMCEGGTATECGVFACNGSGTVGTECATTCAPDGTDDDVHCVEATHCEAGACVDDVPNGEMCDADADCADGVCNTGLCCDAAFTGTAGPEVCNGEDDDCDGAVDEGADVDLCGTPAGGSFSCQSGACALICGSGMYDFNSDPSDGCECAGAASNVCGAATDLGNFPVGSTQTVTGSLGPGGERWYRASFTGGRTGRVHIELPAGTSLLAEAARDCMSSGGICEPDAGAGTPYDEVTFFDNVGMDHSPDLVAWPTTMYFRIYDGAAPTACADTPFSFTVSR